MIETGHLIERFTAGETISLERPTELVIVEGALTDALLEPSPSIPEEFVEDYQIDWAHRPRLDSEIRPARFHGSLLGITLTPMENACEKLRKERISVFRNRPEVIPVFGFVVRAALRSGARRDAGNVERNVWIYTKEFNEKNPSGELWCRHIGKEQGKNHVKSILRRSEALAGADMGTTGGKKRTADTVAVRELLDTI